MVERLCRCRRGEPRQTPPCTHLEPPWPRLPAHFFFTATAPPNWPLPAVNRAHRGKAGRLARAPSPYTPVSLGQVSTTGPEASQVHSQVPTLWTRKGLLSPNRGPTTSGVSPTNTEKHRNRYTIKNKQTTTQGETHTRNRHMQMHTHPHRYTLGGQTHTVTFHTRRKAP